MQRVFDEGANALRVLLGGTVSDDAPSSPVEGDFWYESDTGSFFVRVGGSWVEIASGTGTLPGLSDVTISSPADNEVLAYDTGTSEWINQTPSEAGLVAKADYDAQTILAATSDNTPAALTVAEQTLVGRITGGNIDDLSASQVRTLLDVPTNAEAVLDSLYDANTILKADSDNTPEALTVAEQRIVGRITGGEITGLTSDEVQTFIDTGIEGWHYVGETGEPEFENSWDNLGFGQTELAFRKIGNVVYLAGVVWEGGGAFSTDTIFTLPSGYRPASACQAAALASDFSGNTVFAGAIVGTDGTVSPSVNPGDGTYAIYSFASGQWGFVLDPPSSA